MQNQKPVIIDDPLMTIVVNDAGLSFQPAQSLTDAFGKNPSFDVFYSFIGPSGQKSKRNAKQQKQ